jgi:hypothetical protein
METLNLEDVSLLCSYRKENLKEIEEHSRALDLELVNLLNHTITMSDGESQVAQRNSQLALFIVQFPGKFFGRLKLYR